MTGEPTVAMLTLPICTLCLGGKAGECHVPGCVFWMCPAPSAEQAERIRGYAFVEIVRANADAFEGPA